MKVKRIISIILCIATLFSVLSLTAFAEEQEPYAEIKFRDPAKYNVAFGKTEEVYLDYSTGGIENYKIEWDVSKKLPCKIEYIKDEAGHITSAKLTGRNFGDLTLTATILDENGDEIVSANKLIRVVESEGENKTFREKFKIFLKDSYITSALMTMYFVVPGVFAVVFSPVLIPYYAYLTVKHIIVDRL